MTAPSSPRHLLVIAPQCPDMGLLSGLEEAAGSLYAALLDRRVGGCEREAGAASLVCGPSVTQARIEAAVRDAARHAGRVGAELVLAFIGHGTTQGGIPKLFLMAGDSLRDEPTTVVSVGDLLTQALDTQGVQGVIALVDTCHAGGATPDIAALDAGIRRGAVNLSLLMSVGVGEEAYDLAFTRGLNRVLRDGIAGAGSRLSAEDVRDAVNRAMNIGARAVESNGDPFRGRLWLARNSLHARGGEQLLGRIGREDLDSALLPFGEDGEPLSNRISSPTDPADLAHLQQRLRDLARSGAANPDDVTYAERVLDGLRDAARAAELLKSWPGAPLTSERLRRAVSTVDGAPAGARGNSGGELLRDCVEFLRLRAPVIGASRLAPLAAFVAALAAEDGLDAGHPALRTWAKDTGAVVELNDAFEWLAGQEAESRLRLVVSLHAALADEWPDTLPAWLLDTGRLVAHEEFPCSPTQRGVEEQLASVLRWAYRLARPIGADLRRIEIAVPSPLLLRWRPEETNLGFRLGARHDVVLRWSDRLCLPEHLWWINTHARDQLTAMKAGRGDGAPVDWLGKPEAGSTEELARKLADGAYGRALALSHLPDRIEQFMPLLLAHAPIVLWPKYEGELAAAARESVERHWDKLPKEFSVAYRKTWQQGTGQDHAEGTAALARMRSVWHDTDWLDFCDWFETRTTDGENAQ
ncbi:hypothetical protein ACGF0D_27465 [Kitasatospora sp. NPDC048298]|uniref:vWA-MoxR associated conflict system protein n=1 Tax=Kitasatospora sp. NPDC048298 TaxID=3364049 RepID=UPI0037116E81